MYLVQGVLWEGRDGGGDFFSFSKVVLEHSKSKQLPACLLPEHYLLFFLRFLGVLLSCC